MLKPMLTAMMIVGGTAQGTPSEQAGIAPFAAHYVAAWKSISVGTSDLQLQKDAASDGYVYTWRTSARGIFRLLYSHDVVQTSWFSVNGADVRPQRYHAEDGSSSVSVDFDWTEHRARGETEGKPLDLKLADGAQDVMSIQIQVMLDLIKGVLPDSFRIFDKDEIKEFLYTNEGAARIRTELGELDTVVVASRRAGNNRILRMWFAPKLNYVPVKAERTRDGKLEFAMRISTLRQ